jgi:hypothetical protein
MMNSRTLLDKGFECLTKQLGLVEAERFIALINAEPFDYTEWRKKNLFPDMTVEELSRAAMQYRQKKPSTGGRINKSNPGFEKIVVREGE